MKSILRRIQKLEHGCTPARDSTQGRDILAAIEAGRQRVEKYRKERGECEVGGVRLQVPASLTASLGGIVARLHWARGLAWRQSLFDECQAASAEMGRAVTEQDRAAAQTHSAERERQCQKYGFASSQAFLRNCRKEGWLPGDSGKQTHPRKRNHS
jgi:hypothetical protein